VFYEPAKGHGLPHDPSKAIVAPRPIGWISTIALNGDVNLAPYSFFNAFSTNPFLVWFSSEGEKDRVRRQPCWARGR
jgi:flavin reductase (DIM6/NTAB) family NADH-FMN oxidoreductase RutF